MSDGSITFSTALDNRQLEKELAALKKKITKKEQDISVLRTKLASGKKKSAFDAAELDAEKAKLQEIKDRLADIRAMSKDKGLNPERREEAKALIPSVEEELRDQRTRVNGLQTAWNKTEDAVDRYTAQLAEAEGALERQKGEAGMLQQQIHQAEQARRAELESAQVVDQRIVDLNRELVRLKECQAQLAAAGLGLGHQEYDEIAKGIASASEELKEYQKNLQGVQETPVQMGKAAQKAARYTDNFGRRLKGILASAFVFNILSSGLRTFLGWMGKSVKSNAQARQSIAKLKGALLTLAQPLVEVIIPAFTLFVNILAKAVSLLAQLVSSLFGKTLKQASDSAKALYEEADALGAVGSAAEDAAGHLAGFDEINTIGSGSGGGGGSGSDTIAPDFSGLIAGELSKIQAIVGSALLAIGAILTFSGANIPLGIALMAAGAALLAPVIYENWSAIEEALKGPIGAVTALVSVALLALGAILAFSGVNIPLGIALMAVGALGLAAVVAVNWESLSEVLQGPIGLLTAVVSGALLVLGALLAFSGAIVPLGIALMAIGALGLATVVAVNWESLSEVLQGPIGTLTAVVSGASLALGALLAFSGVNVPLGIALMAIGAVGLVAVAAANWSTIEELLRGPIGSVTGLVSAASLALGAILAFSGVNLPLGLALMAIGAVGLATYAAANWDTVSEYLDGPVGAVTGTISAALLVLGAVLLFSGANIPLGLGLLSVGAVGLATSLAANWETIQNELQGPVGTITALVSSAFLTLGAVLLFSGAAIPLGLGLMAAGAVGLAVSIAANWNTITDATGNTILAITAIVSAALLVLGVVLFFTGAAAPLGLGLLALGAVGLAASIAPNWNFILEAVQKAWSDLKTWWNANVAKYFTLDYWADLGKGMIDGLLSGLSGIFSGLKSWASDVWSTITGVFSSSNARASISGSVSTSGYRMAAMPSIAAYRVPALAKGAVIPPNREFLAVLGDQRSGTNIEAPVSEIEAAVARALQRVGAAGGNRALTVILQVDRRELGRVVYELNREETQRVGVKLTEAHT